MRLIEFINIVEEPPHNELEVGMLFMEGRSLIAQKTSKKVGDWVTYYEVTEKAGNRIQYKPVSVKIEGE